MITRLQLRNCETCTSALKENGMLHTIHKSHFGNMALIKPEELNFIFKLQLLAELMF